MAFPIPDNSRKFDPAPAGLHEAVLVDIIDLGEVVEEYDGETTFKHKMKLVWQLKARNMKINERFQARATYTVSLGENSNFRKMLRSWRGRDFTPEELEGFDLKAVLGAPCMVSVIHSESGKARVDSVLKLPKGTKVPKQSNPSVFFSLEPEEFDADAYSSLSDWFKDTIAKSPEWAVLHKPKAAPVKEEEPVNDFEDGDPFYGADEEVPF